MAGWKEAQHKLQPGDIIVISIDNSGLNELPAKRWWVAK